MALSTTVLTRSLPILAGSASMMHASAGLRSVGFRSNIVISQKQYFQKRNFFRVVSQGRIGYRLFFGRNPTPLVPGPHLVVPLIHDFVEIDMREVGVSIPDLHACTKDNVPVVASGTLFYRVLDPYKACFEVQDYHTSVENVGMSSARAVIGTLHYDDIISNRHGLNSMLSEQIRDTLEPWGITCTKFEVQRFEPENDLVKRQLELQMEAERRRRQQELDTKAAINIAEGSKTSVILKSEGELEAQRNRAAGDRVKMEEIAKGWGNQIKMIAESMKSSPLEAANFLIEMKRIENITEVAKGPNNTTYFFPQKHDLIPQAKMIGDLMKNENKQDQDNLLSSGVNHHVANQ